MGKMVRLPWIAISLAQMISDVVEHGTLTLTVTKRPDVRTRRWYSLHWTSPTGVTLGVAASDMMLLLRRAAHQEQIARMDANDWDDE